MNIQSFYDTMWIFMIFSVLGWIIETFSSSMKNHKINNLGFFVGPICPMYGIVCSLAYILDIYVCKGVFFLEFVFFTVVIVVISTLSNFIFKRIFNIHLWSFSEISPKYKNYYIGSSIIISGLLLVFSTKYIDKFIINILSRELPQLASFIVIIVFLVVFVLDFIFSLFIALGMKHKVSEIGTVLNGVISIEKRAEKAIEKKAEDVKIGSKALKLKLIFIDLKERAKLFFNSIRNKIIIFSNSDNILAKRIRIHYINITTSENVEKLQKSAQKHIEKNMQQYEVSSTTKSYVKFAQGLCYSKLFLMFFAGSIIGCLMETCFALVYEGHFEVRVGLIYGPFIPIYGMGAVLLTIALSRFYKSSFWGLYAISGVVGATFEYFCSWLQEIIFGTISWDYSDMPFNIDGRTSLAYALMWGALGVVWVRELYPIFSRLIEKIPVKSGYVITIILTVFMIFNVFMSSMAQFRADQRANHIPASNALERYLDEEFDDETLKIIYPHMQKAKSTKQ